MKKVVTGLFALLIMWNIALTVQLVNVNTQGEVTNDVVSNITSTLTDVVAEVEDSVVVVYSLQNGQAIGSGSGVVYSKDGSNLLIVTNHHVIDGASEVLVRFNSGTEVIASVVGSDQLSDLAVLSISTNEEVSPFVIGDSSLTKKGETVVAIGSPLGDEFQGSVTAGIISGVDRIIGVDMNNDGIDDWDATVLQTDAAINPGNSGGALINMAGELIGINSMKISSTQVEGIGFAIPSNEMVTIVEAIIKDGKVVRPVLGVSSRSISELSLSERQRLQLEDINSAGLYIVEIVEGSAAQAVGLQVGDVILGINGEEITSFKQFRQALYENKVGDTITLSIQRNGEVFEVHPTLK